MRRLRKLAQTLVSAYVIVASLFLAAAAGTVFLLWEKGVLDAPTLQKLGKVIRHEPAGDEVVKEVPPEEYTQKIQRTKEAALEEVDRRQRALDAEEQQFKLVSQKGIADREAAVKTREEAEDAREKAFQTEAADREALSRAGELSRTSANFKLDLDLLSKVDPKQAAQIIGDMEDPKKGNTPGRALLLIRSLRPRIAADVFSELMTSNPALALKLQEQLTEGPGMTPSETKSLAGRLAAWDEGDLVALLRQVGKSEQENLVHEIEAANSALGAKLRMRLDLPAK